MKIFGNLDALNIPVGDSVNFHCTEVVGRILSKITKYETTGSNPMTVA